VGHEAPGRPDLTYEPLLRDLVQWQRFCAAYANHTGQEYYLREQDAYNNSHVQGSIATAQWAAWLHWVAVYKLTGDGRGSFTTEES
jgi:hypothetical protein